MLIWLYYLHFQERTHKSVTCTCFRFDSKGASVLKNCKYQKSTSRNASDTLFCLLLASASFISCTGLTFYSFALECASETCRCASSPNLRQDFFYNRRVSSKFDYWNTLLYSLSPVGCFRWRVCLAFSLHLMDRVLEQLRTYRVEKWVWDANEWLTCECIIRQANSRILAYGFASVERLTSRRTKAKPEASDRRKRKGHPYTWGRCAY